MFYRPAVFSLCFVLGLGGIVPPVLSQALVPHAVQLNAGDLEKRALILAQEALQLAQFQQFEPALARAELATQLAPQRSEAWALLGGLYLQTEKVDQGISALQRARSLDPKNSGVFFALGSAYFQKKNYPAAAQVLRQGLALKPTAPEALFDLGNAYYMMNRTQDAIAQYEKAAAQDKKFWPALTNIGLVQYEQGNINAAVKQWQAAAAIDAKASEPRLALAVALYNQGKQQQAFTLAVQALKLDGRYADLEFLKENLWGSRLLTDARKLLSTPQVKATIAQLEAQDPGLTLPPE